MQIASRRFAGGKNKREIKRACRRRERKRAKPTRARLLDDGGIGGYERGRYIMVEWRGGKGGRRGRTSALAEGGRGEPVGPRQGASRVEKGVQGGGGGLHGDHSSSEEKRGLRVHTTVPHHTADGGGRLRRWRRWQATHAERSGSVAIPKPSTPTPARLILSRPSTYGWRRGQVIGVLRDAR